MLVCLGDIHFRSDKDYFIKTCNKFIDWFSDWELNSENNTLILAGDLVENSVNGGIVIDFLERFYKASRFSSIRICVGNHDEKKYMGITQLAYEFYRTKKDIFLYQNATEDCIEDCRVLFLPYYTGVNSEGLTMKESYSQIYKNTKFSNNYDLVVGHFSDDSLAFGGSDCVENLNKINTRVLCLGHIHTRVNPKIYIGSVFASRKNENDSTRAAWIITKNTFSEEKLPVFNEFLQVVYPDKLPRSKALIPIYTVFNCANETTARSLYGDIFIRKTSLAEEELAKTSSEALQRKFDSVKDIDILTLFKDFTKSGNLNIDDSIVAKCEKLLSTYNYANNIIEENELNTN